jgi:DASS family divalent anion:Na+ symporter
MNRELKVKLIKLAIMIVAGLAIWHSPVPEGLEPLAWQYFAAFITAILGILLGPLPSPVIMLGVIGIFGLFIPKPASMLSGFSSATTWLVFAAFMISVAFGSTGLGKRIAYKLIGLFGKTSLGLAYALCFTELILGTAIPSTTARTGGVVFPIFNNVSKTLGSTVEEGTSRKLASYITMVSAHATVITASIWLTGMAPNIQIAAFAKDILGVELDWFTWAKMMIVPGVALLAIIPLVLYKIFPPEIKKIDSYKEISNAGLKELGPMTKGEKYLSFFFAGAVALWATTAITGFNATMVALVFLTACLVFKCMTWDDVRQSRGAWDTLIWFGAIIGLSSQLSGAGFFTWFADMLQNNFDFSSLSPITLMLVIVIGALLVRYIFASSTVFTTAMIPVMFTIGLVGGAPLLPLAMLCASCNGYGAMLTNYGGASGPVLFGYGHVTMKEWWSVGHVSAYICVIVYFTIGLSYWKLLGIW